MDAAAIIENAARLRREYVDEVFPDLAFYAGAQKIRKLCMSHDPGQENAYRRTPYQRRLIRKVSIVRLMRSLRRDRNAKQTKDLRVIMKIVDIDHDTKIRFCHAKGHPFEPPEPCDGDPLPSVDDLFKPGVNFDKLWRTSRVIGWDIIDRAAKHANISESNRIFLRDSWMWSGSMTNAEVLASFEDRHCAVMHRSSPMLARLDIATCEILRQRHPKVMWEFYPEYAPESWWDDNVINDNHAVRSSLHSGKRWSEFFDRCKYFSASTYFDEYDRFYDVLISAAAKQIAMSWHQRPSIPGGVMYHMNIE